VLRVWLVAGCETYSFFVAVKELEEVVEKLEVEVMKVVDFKSEGELSIKASLSCAREIMVRWLIEYQ
jgi:hypothetical protein